jgi:hypothetical protein
MYTTIQLQDNVKQDVQMKYAQVSSSKVDVSTS